MVRLGWNLGIICKTEPEFDCRSVFANPTSTFWDNAIFVRNFFQIFEFWPKFDLKTQATILDPWWKRGRLYNPQGHRIWPKPHFFKFRSGFWVISNNVWTFWPTPKLLKKRRFCLHFLSLLLNQIEMKKKCGLQFSAISWGS